MGCEIVNLVPTPTAVLQRDRIIVILALGLLTGLAWSYLLWLSLDMSMAGMDMTGFRVIPSGMALMVPADMPWREFIFVFAMWTVMMVAMMTPSAAPMILMYARVGRQYRVARFRDVKHEHRGRRPLVRGGGQLNESRPIRGYSQLTGKSLNAHCTTVASSAKAAQTRK
jgi:predicted metal-binding integral membrane protein DUF2182